MAQRTGRISITVRDLIGGKATFLTHVKVDDTLTIANANTAIGTVATLLGTVSTAGVVEGRFDLINTAVATAPGDDADVVAGASFNFTNTSDPSRYGQWVPSFIDALVGSGGHIDVTSGVPKDFCDAMIGAILGGRYTNTRYIPNDAAVDAFLSDRKRRKRVY